MKISILTFIAFTFLAPSAWTITTVRAQGALFTVNNNGDTVDANVGDGICADSNGKCTLRAAIQEAGNNNYENGINFGLPIPSTIDLTLGELVVTSNIYIAGPGARNLTIRRSVAPGTPNFRVLDFVPNIGSLLYVRGLKIENGRVPDGDGGGIYVEAGNIITLSDLVVTGNTANRGGGIANAGALVLQRSLVDSNSAITNQSVMGVGGGFFSQGPFGATDIVNSTFTKNSAVAGGSIYNSRPLFLINDTISHNNADNDGCSIVNTAGGTATFLNTIIGMDTSAINSSLSGSFNSLSNNLITDARNSTGFIDGVKNDQVSNNNAINPLLGDLADNGGQTDTRALLDGSPAINRGNNCVYYGRCPQPFPPDYSFGTDQRLNHYRLGGTTVDIGSYEDQALTIGGHFGIGAFGLSNRGGGLLRILTSASRNEKQARISNPFGNYHFDNLDPVDVYFLEYKSKHVGQFTGLQIIELDGLLPSQAISGMEKKGLRIIVEK